MSAAVTFAPDCAARACDSPSPPFAGSFDWTTSGHNGHNAKANGFAESKEDSSRVGPTPPDPPAPEVEIGGPTVDANGNLREESVADADRNYVVALHLSPLAFLWVGPFALIIPLVMWLVKKDESRFINDHGRETVNFLLTWALLSTVLVWTIVVPIALTVVAIVSVIRGSIAASRREYFRYPMTIRFLT